LVINRVRVLGSGPHTLPNFSGSTPRGGLEKKGEGGSSLPPSFSHFPCPEKEGEGGSSYILVLTSLQGRNQLYGIRDHSLGIGIMHPGSRVTSDGIGISQFFNVLEGIKDQSLFRYLNLY